LSLFQRQLSAQVWKAFPIATKRPKEARIIGQVTRRPKSLPRATRRPMPSPRATRRPRLLPRATRRPSQGRCRGPQGGQDRCRGLHEYLRRCRGLLGDQERLPGLHVGLWRSKVVAKDHKEAKVVAEGYANTYVEEEELKLVFFIYDIIYKLRFGCAYLFVMPQTALWEPVKGVACGTPDCALVEYLCDAPD
jgi:hypothetical protein